MIKFKVKGPAQEKSSDVEVGATLEVDEAGCLVLRLDDLYIMWIKPNGTYNKYYIGAESARRLGLQLDQTNELRYEGN